MTPQPDINIVLGELSMQIANLTRENAILKATIQAMRIQPQPQKQAQNVADGGELES
jgi:hypothetical protein